MKWSVASFRFEMNISTFINKEFNDSFISWNLKGIWWVYFDSGVQKSKVTTANGCLEWCRSIFILKIQITMTILHQQLDYISKFCFEICFDEQLDKFNAHTFFALPFLQAVCIAALPYWSKALISAPSAMSFLVNSSFPKWQRESISSCASDNEIGFHESLLFFVHISLNFHTF